MTKIHKLNELSEKKVEKEKEKTEAQRSLTKEYEGHISEIDKEISEVSKPYNVRYKNSKNQVFIESYYQPVSRSLGLDVENIWNNTTVEDVMKYCAIYEAYDLANRGVTERMPSEDEINKIIELWKNSVLGVINER